MIKIVAVADPDDQPPPRGYTREARSGGWSVRVRHAGRRPRRTFRTPELAEAFIQEAEAARQAGQLAQLLDRDATVSYWFDEMLREVAPEKYARSTIIDYVEAFTRHVEPHIGHVPASSVHDHLEAWLRTLRTLGVGISTIHKAASALSAALEHARSRGCLATNPMPGFKLPRKKQDLAPTPAPSPLIAEQFRCILDRPTDKLLVSLVMYAGLRPEEALAVALSVIRGDTEQLWIWRAIAHGELAEIKNKKQRRVPILDPLADDLRQYIENTRPDNQHGLLITRPDGLPWTLPDYRLFAKRFKRAKRWTDASGLDYTPYDLRAGYATMMLDSGTSLRDVAADLGDREDTVLRYYSRSGQDPDRKLPPEEQIRRARARVAEDPPRRPKGRPSRNP